MQRYIRAADGSMISFAQKAKQTFKPITAATYKAKDVMDDVLYKFNKYLYGKQWGDGNWGDYTIAHVDLYGESVEHDYISVYVKAYEETPDGRIKRINLTPAKFSFKITDENYNDYDKDLYNAVDKWLASQPA